MQTNYEIIPELLAITRLTEHEKGLNNEIAVHLDEEDQKRMYRTMRKLLADEFVFVLNLEVTQARIKKG